MRAITKGAEPDSLVQHRCSPHANYDNYPDKNTLRTHLVSEQNGLCCYCMSRIAADEALMKIEHWHSQTTYENEQLDYQNLLGACLGGKGKPPGQQTCDTRKGNDDIKWNPANPTHQVDRRIKYSTDGTIGSNDLEFDRQMNDILNLNIKFLKDNRRSVLDGVAEWWKREKNRIQGPISRDRLEGKKAKYIVGAGALEPYCHVAVWWLDRKLA